MANAMRKCSWWRTCGLERSSRIRRFLSRRLGGLLLQVFPSSFRSSGAGAAGESGQSRSPTIQPFQALPPRILRICPSPGHAPTRISSAWRSATRVRAFPRGLVGRSGPSLDSPDGAPGVQPFAGLLPQAGWLDISAQPGPHVVRAFRPPRFIFVGVTVRLSEQIIEGRSAEDENASTSGLRSRLRSVSVAHRSATDRSCLGLCLFQGWRARFTVHPNRLDPVRDHQPPEILGRFRDRAFPIRSWAFRRVLPSRHA